jgi:hypothetical protein
MTNLVLTDRQQQQLEEITRRKLGGATPARLTTALDWVLDEFAASSEDELVAQVEAEHHAFEDLLRQGWVQQHLTLDDPSLGELYFIFEAGMDNGRYIYQWRHGLQGRCLNPRSHELSLPPELNLRLPAFWRDRSAVRASLRLELTRAGRR